MKPSRSITNLWLKWVLAKPLILIAVALALAIISVLYAFKTLDFHTGQLDLISPKNPLIRLTKRLKPFERKDQFMVVVDAPRPSEAVRFIQELARRIHSDAAYFKEIDYRIDPQEFKKWALLYLSPDEIKKISDNLREFPALIKGLADGPDLLNFFRLINRELASRMIGELFTGFLEKGAPKGQRREPKDYLDLSFLVVMLEDLVDYLEGKPRYRSPWSSFFGEGTLDLTVEGYYWTDQKRLLFAFVTPVRERQTFNKAQRSLSRLRGHIREVLASMPNVKAGVTGQEALKTDEMATAFGDMSRAMWLSLAGVWLLMFLFLRHPTRPLLEMSSLAVGLCWTFGAAALVVGHLNILSVVFAPLLVGLGVDYGIHFFARYEEEEGRSSSVIDIIQRVFHGSGKGILLAGLSGALSFLPLVLTGFKGLVELGLITGVGILLTLLADFTVLPALSLLLAGRRVSRALPHKPKPPERPLGWRGRKAWWVLTVALIACAASIWGATGVQFDLNPLRLQAKGTESVIWEKRLSQEAGRSILYATALAHSPGETISKASRFSLLDSVGDVKTVFTLLPKDQDRKLGLLKPLRSALPAHFRWDGLPSPDPKELIEVLERIRFKMQSEKADRWVGKRPLVDQMERIRGLALRAIHHLQGDHRVLKNLSDLQETFVSDLREALDFIRSGSLARKMTVDDVPLSLRDRFLRDGLYLIRVYPKGDVWERAPLDRFITQIRGVDPDVTGDPVTLHDFTEAFKRACVKASIYASAAILVLLSLVFKGSWLSLLAMVPLAVGTLWTLGLMRLLGIHFNAANSIFMPLVVGAGVEYGIIIAHRWIQASNENSRVPYSTAKGVTLAALTTTVGFGSLMISRHRGIFSLGALAFMGSLCVLLSALTVLPSLLMILSSKGFGKPIRGGRQ